MDVICEIERAFAGVTLGDGVGLSEGRAIDDNMPDGVRASMRSEDEEDYWQAIPVERLFRDRASLSFFDAEGMRFHLPAFMIAALGGNIDCDPTFYLTDLDDWQRSRFARLTTAERRAVVTYLRWRLMGDAHRSEIPRIEAALNDYWERKPAPPK